MCRQGAAKEAEPLEPYEEVVGRISPPEKHAARWHLLLVDRGGEAHECRTPDTVEQVQPVGHRHPRSER